MSKSDELIRAATAALLCKEPGKMRHETALDLLAMLSYRRIRHGDSWYDNGEVLVAIDAAHADESKVSQP